MAAASFAGKLSLCHETFGCSSSRPSRQIFSFVEDGEFRLGELSSTDAVPHAPPPLIRTSSELPNHGPDRCQKRRLHSARQSQNLTQLRARTTICSGSRIRKSPRRREAKAGRGILRFLRLEKLARMMDEDFKQILQVEGIICLSTLLWSQIGTTVARRIMSRRSSHVSSLCEILKCGEGFELGRGRLDATRQTSGTKTGLGLVKWRYLGGPHHMQRPSGRLQGPPSLPWGSSRNKYLTISP